MSEKCNDVFKEMFSLFYDVLVLNIFLIRSIARSGVRFCFVFLRNGGSKSEARRLKFLSSQVANLLCTSVYIFCRFKRYITSKFFWYAISDWIEIEIYSVEICLLGLPKPSAEFLRTSAITYMYLIMLFYHCLFPFLSYSPVFLL
jgi:hypothetical protein